MFLFNLSVPSIIYEMTQGLRHIQGRRHNNLEAGRNFFLLLWNSFFLFPQFHPSSSSIFNHFLFFLFCSSWGIQLSGGHSVSASESQLNNQSLDLSLFQHCRSAASQGKNGRRQADGDQTKKMQKKMRNVEQKGGTNWKLLPLRACKTKVALTVPNYPIFLSFFHLFEGKTAFLYTAPLSLKFERKVAAAINLNSKKKKCGQSENTCLIGEGQTHTVQKKTRPSISNLEGSQTVKCMVGYLARVPDPLFFFSCHCVSFPREKRGPKK